jgi:hypothetical protein
MQVFCSNCNTAHDVTYEQANNAETSVITCKKCDKHIKFQFCPHCGAFYSITFSNIKQGKYRYTCRKCTKDFAIEFSPEERIKIPEIYAAPEPAPAQTEQKNGDSSINLKTHETVSFMNNSINTFSVNELFKAASEAFNIKKIFISAITVVCMLIVIQIFSLMENLFIKPSIAGLHAFAGSFINLFPLALIFSFYILCASIISKITLDRIFHSKETALDEVIKFTIKTGPGIFTGNIIVLLIINSMLILFGKIPYLGPLLFSFAFLPVYLFSVVIFMLCFIGLWFYPPISAHRENGIFANAKNMMLFIKKHNLSIIFMIPVIALVAGITFSIVFLLHLSAFSFSIAMSRWLLNTDASVIFSSIPALFIKASEATFAGFSSGIFKELNNSLLMTHHIGGLILGITLLSITVFLLSIFVSITATVSSHIYIVMERGLSIDDRKKSMVLAILIMMLTLFIMLRKLL